MKIIRKIIRCLGGRPRIAPHGVPLDEAIADTRAAIAETEQHIALTHEQLAELSTSLISLKAALNEVEPPEPEPAPPAIAEADVMFRADAGLPFEDQAGATIQCINTYTALDDVPENGIHGTPINGETLRFGKVTDPAQSSRKAFHHRVQRDDPTTSDGKRVEFSLPSNIVQDKVYWLAVSAYVYNWGTLNEADKALFACQMHTAENDLKLSPSFGLYTSSQGRKMTIRSRTETSTPPNSDNAKSTSYTEKPIAFGQWFDVVIKFKNNTKGNAIFQCWIDGEQVANMPAGGNLGYNGPSGKYYAKFGYYNWSHKSGDMGDNPRKVLLRSPMIVRDPTGDTYTEAQLRAALA